jgi:chromosomal replication initiator protein
VAQKAVERLAQQGEAEPRPKIVQFCGVEFAREYAAAVAGRRVPAWRESVRGAALLVLEDIEPLQDKIAAQSELIHTIDAILNAGGQILVTSRKPIGEMAKLLPGLVSRLSGGLCLAMPRPEWATRAALLQQLAAARGLRLQPNAARLLAEKLEVTAPELSGALNEVAASLTVSIASRGASTTQNMTGRRRVMARGTEIDVAAVRAYLHQRTENGRVTLHDVARKAARHYGLKVADLRSASRRQGVVAARNLAMHVARQLTAESLSSIGAYFGGRDHTTVMHGCQRAKELVASDPRFRQAALQVRADLGV